MDNKTRSLLATPEFRKYMVKSYLKKQLIGMVRVFQGRYPGYMTITQMNAEIIAIEKALDVLDIQFIEIPRGENGSPIIIQNPVRNHKVVKSDNRCHARVWDVNNLVWRCNGRQVYGSQCRNPKISDGSSNYCRKHIKKLTHEDWFTEPSEKMRRHFMQGFTSVN